MPKKILEIYTDGSCRGNPGPGGWAAIILEKDTKKQIATVKGHESETTNNRMEMIAAIESLRFVRENHLHNADILLHSDSSLIVKTFNEGWKRKANLDLWDELDELNEELSVEYIWVRGHNNHYWNEKVDKLALAEATKAKKSPKSIEGKSYGKRQKLL